MIGRCRWSSAVNRPLTHRKWGTKLFELFFFLYFFFNSGWSYLNMATHSHTDTHTHTQNGGVRDMINNRFRETILNNFETIFLSLTQSNTHTHNPKFSAKIPFEKKKRKKKQNNYWSHMNEHNTTDGNRNARSQCHARICQTQSSTIIFHWKEIETDRERER